MFALSLEYIEAGAEVRPSPEIFVPPPHKINKKLNLKKPGDPLPLEKLSSVGCAPQKNFIANVLYRNDTKQKPSKPHKDAYSVLYSMLTAFQAFPPGECMYIRPSHFFHHF